MLIQPLACRDCLLFVNRDVYQKDNVWLDV